MKQSFEVKAKTQLGQHFLADGRVIAQLIHAINPKRGEALLEIGPGLGALTLPLLRVAGALTALEVDGRVIDILRAKAAPLGQLNLIHGDFLRHDLGPGCWRLVGNLPYQLSSPILAHCVAARAHILDMHFMLQKEVVERLCAEPGNRDYGRLSLLLQRHFEPEALFDIPPEAFSPPPRVQSAVVRLTPRPAPAWAVADEAAWDAIVRTAFGQRRKMLRQSLKAYFSSAELEALGIDPTARPENLSGGDFATLANAKAGLKS